MKRFRGKRPEKRYLGAAWVEGATGYLAVAVGPADPDRGRLVDLRECDAAHLGEEIALLDDTIRRVDGASVDWLLAVRGDGAILESCAVPREVANAPAETRALACLAGTAWGDPDAAASMRLALAYQLDGDRCLIAAAREAVLLEEQARIPSPSARLTAVASALAELVRAAHPSVARVPGSCALATLCSERDAAFVIIESGVAVVARQVSLEDRLAEIGRRHAYAGSSAGQDGAADPEPEFETGGWSPDTHNAAWRREPVAVDPSRWRAAVFAELRETLDLYREAGGHASDVTTILVTGEAADRFDLRAALPGALGDDVDIYELEASRIVTSDDMDLARRVTENEMPLAGVFALLAAGRRSDLLAFGVCDDRHFDGLASPERAPARSYAGLACLATALVWVAIVAVSIGAGRIAWVRSQLEEVTVALEAERRRSEELRAVATERSENEARYRHTLALVQAMEALRARQGAPLRLLEEVGARLPRGATLSQVTLVGADVTIAGESEDATLGARFALDLQAADALFGDVTPSTEHSTYLKEPIADPSLPAEERPRELFTVQAKFRPAVADPRERAALTRKEPTR